jgi:2-phospho-L-lactate guanylyltransferase
MPDPRSADLDRLHALVPLRTISGGKARLGGLLDAEERESLVAGMLRHTLRTLAGWPAVSAVHVVSPDPLALELARREGAQPVRQTDSGLNEALLAGRAAVAAATGTALLVLPADLPLLTIDALDGLLEAADATLAAGGGRPLVVVAAADARGGTNALLVSPIDTIEPGFGADSLERHLRAAAKADAATQVVVDGQLGFDLDTAEDLERLDAERLDALVHLGSELVTPRP